MRLRTLALFAALAAPAPLALAQHGDAHAAPEGAHATPEGHGEAAEHGEAGAHGAHHVPTVGEVFRSPDFQGALWNFALLVTIIVVFAGPKIKGSLVERRRTLEEGFAKAARLREEAEAKKKEYTERLAKLEGELESIRHEMVKAGEAERDRMIAEAEKRASRMRKDTGFRIEQRLKELEQDLTREAVQAAVAAAEDVLKEKTSAADQQRLADNYLTRLAAAMEQRKGGRA